ncbi:hypothetical protein Cob_v013226 [Colletotrichum orbiculare MAFF 240422]|uniref:Uncharacterized protein n=1 Tax=Colletotrichum orbiculare (strain 104-T / ATCC 96160 / CBS 514.97 / LARS 414 / MAFF 240422) TaxID=1213857 RepID=A0A484F891_COLOR|nr:hypothetical protein Cob_v013226 [Colletotrichum orbiculare MAFF 240422]
MEVPHANNLARPSFGKYQLAPSLGERGPARSNLSIVEQAAGPPLDEHRRADSDPQRRPNGPDLVGPGRRSATRDPPVPVLRRSHRQRMGSGGNLDT